MPASGNAPVQHAYGMRFPCHKTTKALQYVLQPNLADTAKESRAAYLKMADNEEDHVVADIDDTAERPMSDHEGDSEQEDASSMDGPDDSTHAFTGHTGRFWCPQLFPTSSTDMLLKPACNLE